MAKVRFKRDSIRKLRQSRGLTLSDFARKMGSQRQAVLLWEAGGSYPSVINLVRMINAFGVKPTYFFSKNGITRSRANRN